MKLNPLTKELYTDNGEFIKRMHCPLGVHWEKLSPNPEIPYVRDCRNCDNPIIDTSNFSDDEILAIVRKDPGACFKVDYNQQNIIILYGGVDKEREHKRP